MNKHYPLLLSLAFAAQLSAMETQPISNANSNNLPLGCTEAEDTALRFVYLERLCAAIKTGNPKLVKKALEVVKDVNDALPDTKDTPLHVAYHTSPPDVEILSLLLARGARESALNSHSATPMEAMICRYRNGQLIRAIKNSHQAEIIAQLINEGANPNTRTSDNEDALSLALTNELYGIAQVLLDKGANAKKTYAYGNTALHLLTGTKGCILNKDSMIPLAEALLNAGAPLDAKNILGKTPLTLAQSNHYLKAVAEFLEKKQFPNETQE